MKKNIRLLSVLCLILMMAVALAGCRKPQALQDLIPEGEAEQQEAEDEKTDETEEADEEESHGEHMLWLQGTAQVYVIDDNGKKIAEYDLNDLKEKTPENYACSTYALIGYNDGILYFSENGLLPGYDHTTGYMLYAVEGDTGETQLLWAEEEDSDESVWQTGMYNGEFYAAVKSSEGINEFRFTKLPDEFYFDTFQGDYDELLDTAGEKNWGLWTTEGSSLRGSFTGTLDTVGFILAYDNENSRYMLLYADGGAKLLTDMPSGYINLAGYDEHYIAYTYSDWEKDTNELYCYDIDENETRKLMDLDPYYGDSSLLGYYDGALYVRINTGNEYGHGEYEVNAFVPSLDQWAFIYSEEEKPGAKGTVDYTGYGFERIEDYAYVTSLQGDTLMWARLDYEDEDAHLTDIDCPIKKISVFEYGTADYGSITYCCPNCGTTLLEYYDEYFILDKKYSPKADKINAYLKDRFDETMDRYRSAENEEVDESACEEHQEYPRMYRETDEVTLDSVKIINDKYMTVNKSGYWYGGGAHGYPSRSQTIFDLTTGEALSVSDFFDGSEEDFRKLCAEKTKDDYLSYDEYSNPYFISSPEDIYNQAYEEAGFDRSYVDFEEDGVYIYYMPYDMGSYASGFIDIKILDADVYKR